jgi:hypothetical protein
MNQEKNGFTLAEFEKQIEEYLGKISPNQKFIDLTPINYRWIDEEGRQCSAWKLGDLMTGDGGKAMYDKAIKDAIEQGFPFTTDEEQEQEQEKISVEQAMNVVSNELVQNEEYRDAWKAMLTLSFIDEVLKNDKSSLLNIYIINEIAKGAADRFLNIITAKVE